VQKGPSPTNEQCGPPSPPEPAAQPTAEAPSAPELSPVPPQGHRAASPVGLVRSEVASHPLAVSRAVLSTARGAHPQRACARERPLPSGVKMRGEPNSTRETEEPSSWGAAR
jgi:hypothetical protein